jgi:hypothetical protein
MNRTEAAAKALAARTARAPSLHDRFWSKVDRRSDDDCWPWIASVRRKDEGYGAFYFNGRHHPAPRIAWMLTHQPVPAGMVVCHRCDNPRCCNPAHLFIGTPRDNDADRVAKQRQARGSRNGFAKLTEFDVWFIRRARARLDASPGMLARLYGITGEHVWSLCNAPVWRHVHDDDPAYATEARRRWAAWKQGARHGA